MLNELKCVCENVEIDKYLELYKYVRENMEHPEWLGTFTKEEINGILKSPFSTTCRMGSYLGSLSFTVLTSIS